MSVYYKGCPFCERVFEIGASGTPMDDPLALHLRLDHGGSDSGTGRRCDGKPAISR